MSSQYFSIPTVISTFSGVTLALALGLVFNNVPGNTAGAVENEQAVAKTAEVDFAKFAYAFNQGYQANLTSASVTSTCTDPEAVATAKAMSPGSGATAMSSPSGAMARTVSMPGYGQGQWSPKSSVKGHVTSHKTKAPAYDHYAAMTRAYTTYNSTVHNSSSVTNTNSNNVVGSHNQSSNTVKVEDSLGVKVDLNTTQTATQNQASNSFNEDSYNTENETLVIEESFNEENNLAINSGNMVTENTAVNTVHDAYNTNSEVETTTDTSTVTNTTNETTNVDTTVTNIENSQNAVHGKENEVEIDT